MPMKVFVKKKGRLLSETSIGDKKIKIPVCASLK